MREIVAAAARNHEATTTVSRVFLVELLVCGILTLFFLFYFNRLFATLVSYGIRAYTWHKYRVYVDIQALQISLLGGRIFFKGFRYHGENETILVQGGYLTWRYWLRSVRHVNCSRVGTLSRNPSAKSEETTDDLQSGRSRSVSGEERGGIKGTHELPCRIAIFVQGVEWFVYNRSPAYDAIVSNFQAQAADIDRNGRVDKKIDPQLSKRTSPEKPEAGFSEGGDVSPSLLAADIISTKEDDLSTPLETTSAVATDPRSQKDSTNGASMSQILNILPVRVECQKGAIVLGNENTKSVFTVTFEDADGQIDAGGAGPLDLYRQIFDFKIVHPIVQIKPNPDFKESQMAAADRLTSAQKTSLEQHRQKHFQFQYQYHKRKVWRTVRDLVPYFQNSVESFHPVSQRNKTSEPTTPYGTGLPGEARWLGLTRYLGEDDRDDHEGWDSVEYARFSTIVDCPSVNMNFYWDVPGQVPAGPSRTSSARSAPKDINGHDPPAWGLDLIIRGGLINYGPWADRERVDIQNVFFPSPFRDAQPAEMLKAGSPRFSTVFNVHVEIEEETTLRIPTREESKDWLWKGRADAVRGASKLKKQKEKKNTKGKKTDKGTLGPDVRPFGWLGIRVQADSTVSYTMDMVANDLGYRNQLDLDLRGTKMTSSVNHGLLWQCERQTVSCDLSNPLGWNSLHHWKFDIESNGLDFYILRDHMFLLTDLIGDWASGASADFYTFVPFQYSINLRFTDLKLFLNVNDANIINNPSDMDDNAFLVIGATRLDGTVGIPLLTYRPNQNAVTFEADAHDARLELVTPPWNTQHTFLSDQPIALLKAFGLTGRYCYCFSTSTALTDTLILNLSGVSPTMNLHGFLIRYFMKVKDNYFGDDLHFRTLEEFQEMLTSKESTQGNHGINRNKQSNDLDVILYVKAEKASALLPANLYSRKDTVKLEVLLVEADMRFTNYYMDMNANFSPLEASLKTISSEDAEDYDSVTNTQLFVDGVNIYGHRLFGLPPTEPTYVCNWDFHVGKVIGECSSAFVRTLALAMRAFIFTLDDKENALPLLHAIALHDITFLRATVDSVRVWLLVDQTALLLGTGRLDVRFDDWAGLKYSERLHVTIPDLTVAAVDRKTAARYRSWPHPPVTTYAYFQTSVDLRMIEQKPDFSKDRALQQHHVRFHDQRTRRTDWLLHEGSHNEGSFKSRDRLKVNPPAMPFPHMPEPITRSDTMKHIASPIDDLSSSRHRLNHKSSLLSSRSSHLGSTTSALKAEASRKSSTPIISRTQSRHALLTGEGVSSTTQIKSLKSEYLAPEVDDKASLIGLPRESETEAHGLPPSTVAYSSPWLSPYFPLDKIEPDLKHVPVLPTDLKLERKASNDDQPQALVTQNGDDKSPHISFICNLSTGMKGFCSPEFLHSISSIIGSLRPTHPIDVLDGLQVVAMSKILLFANKGPKARQVTDLSLCIPYAHVRVINSLPSDGENKSLLEEDEYNVILSRGHSTTRMRLRREREDDRCESEQILHAHVAAESLSIAAQEKSVHSNEKAAVRGRLEDLVFWIVSDSSINSKLQVKDIEVATSSKKVEYLASLIHRTTEMFNSIANDFQTGNALQTRRLQQLAYMLTTSGSGVPDPSFLTRPSYVLRAAGDHLRSNDSWKIISRFRYIYNSLPKTEKDRILRLTDSNVHECPPNAEALVTASFDQWRAWDLAHVKKSYVMEMIWGSIAGVPELHPHKSIPMGLSTAIGGVRFLLDPGPKQNEFVVDDLSVGLSVNVPLMTGTGLPITISSSAHTTALQVYCSSIALRLNWELCELVEDSLKVYGGAKPKTASSHITTQHHRAWDQHVHLVFATDMGTVVIDTINLKAALLSKGLRGSIVHKTAAGLVENNTTSVLISSDSASSEFLSHARVLMICRLWHPNIYGSQSSHILHEKSENDWKLAGACETLHYEMKEDLLNIIDVADRVIKDEVAYVYAIITNLNLADTPVTPSSTSIHSSARKLSVAMFLDDYQISIAVLPSLTYVISGEVARTSLTSKPDSKTVVDFDLKGHSHAFRPKGDGKTRNISILDMPPINGRVVVYPSQQQTTIDFDTTVESIKLEAAAVQSLLTTIKRPEISRGLADVKKETQLVKSHLEYILARSTPVPRVTSPEQIHQVFYRGQTTIAGIGIHASAPGIKNRHYSADLNLNFELVQLHLANRSREGGPVLEYPKFSIRLSQILLDLKRRDDFGAHSFGRVAFGTRIDGTSQVNEKGEVVRALHVASESLEIDLYAETAFMIVDVAAHLQEHIKTLDLSTEVRQFRSLRRFTRPELVITRAEDDQSQDRTDESTSSDLFTSMYSIELLNIRVSWLINTSTPISPGRDLQDLVFSIKKIDLATRRENSARLGIDDLQLQMVPKTISKDQRSLNSALMPEVVFNVAYLSSKNDRRLAFQAAGKALDLRLTSEFIVPASILQASIASATKELREANALWADTPAQETGKKQNLFSSKRLASLLVDADFAGAVVNLQGRRVDSDRSVFSAVKGSRPPQGGRYGQFLQGNSTSNATLRAPGIALKVEYKDNGLDDPSLNAEMKVDASSNVLYPTVVPLIMEISSSVKEIVGEPGTDPATTDSKPSPQKYLQDKSLGTSDPSAILGRCRLNACLLICQQEFTLSCQPIARVMATSRFNSIYITVNTVQSADQSRFFALLVAFNSLQASVQHVYSRESTASFDVESIVVSLMNSKHVSTNNGISAILKISPMKAQLNVKQMQDFLLFREIWVPPEIRQASATAPPATSAEPQAYMVQRYQQVAAAGAFPWNATVAIAELNVQTDLGQSLGKSAFSVANFWVSSRKSSDWEQNLCLGFEKIGIDSTGRMSGFVQLEKFRVRMAIQWLSREKALDQTPLIQASLGFDELRVKAAFDYQAFAIADISAFEFLMYNVRNTLHSQKDRLVGILDGNKVQAFCTTSSASQGLALYQAVQRLIQEKEAAYEASLKEIERFLRRKSVFPAGFGREGAISEGSKDEGAVKTPISLHTDVIVTLRAVNVGAFPSTFFDSQIFKVEALDAQARFAVALENHRTHSGLGLTLGQLRVALAGVNRPNTQALGDASVADIVTRATGAKGGIILRVPKVIATMQTWQTPSSNHIDYIFKSAFEGKVDVGWNYSRISFIRGMWINHSRALAQRLGKPLPQSVVRITGGPQPEDEGGEHKGQEKITAVVDVPQSKYEYTALEPPIIETPQLRDMGEATPPLEWIGLHRERLPNLTHQIIIVTLLEIAKEVEDAYSKILGSS